jgi:hypothetical protein
MHQVSYLWRNLGPRLLWLWPLIIIDKELREFAVVNSLPANNPPDDVNAPSQTGLARGQRPLPDHA